MLVGAEDMRKALVRKGYKGNFGGDGKVLYIVYVSKYMEYKIN